MTRQKFYEQCLLKTESIDKANELLLARDSIRNCAEEQKDIFDFAKNTKNFRAIYFNTPFGKIPAFLEASMYNDYYDWFKKHISYSMSIDEPIIG